MPFGKHDDYTLNPHLLDRGSATAVPGPAQPKIAACTGPVKQGNDQYVGHTGLFITAKRLPAGQFHRIRVDKDTDPRRMAINFTSEATTLIGCISPPNFYPERPFNQGAVDRLFLYANSFNNQPACFGGPTDRPIRGCPTAYGWFIEVDSGGTGNYDVTVLFFEGP